MAMDLSLIGAVAPAPTPSLDAKSEGQAATEVFARILVQELQRSLPEGGMLGGGSFAPLEALVTDALVKSLTAGDGLGLGQMFDGPGVGGPTGTHHAAPGPVAVADGPVSSPYGPRVHPVLGRHHHHSGIDIAAPLGSPVRAARAGTVKETRFESGYGNLVVVEHAAGLETWYAHLDTIRVEAGDAVQAGATLATVGNTGRTTGPHLHFEVRQEGRPIDPTPWLPEGSHARAHREPNSSLTPKAKAAPGGVDTLREDPGS